MERKKIVLILLVLAAFFAVIFLLSKRRPDSGSNQPKGLSMENLVQTKNDSEVLNREVSGKIKTIADNALVVVDDKSPIKKMTKDGAGSIVSLKTNDATSVVFFEKGKLQEKKSLPDLRIGDDVLVKYNILTKEIIVVKVSIDGAEFSDGGSQIQPLLK